jgi:hypothetical protein
MVMEKLQTVLLASQEANSPATLSNLHLSWFAGKVQAQRSKPAIRRGDQNLPKSAG